MDATRWGEPRPIPKTKEELCRELEMLLETWVDAKGVDTSHPDIAQAVQDVVDTFEESMGELEEVCKAKVQP